jgi:hypothetical protein
MTLNESALKGFFRKRGTNLLYIELSARAAPPGVDRTVRRPKRVRKIFLDKLKIRAI